MMLMMLWLSTSLRDHTMIGDEIHDTYAKHLAIKYPLPTIADIAKHKPVIDLIIDGGDKRNDLCAFKLKHRLYLRNSFLYQVFIALRHEQPDVYTAPAHERVKSFLRIPSVATVA